MHVGDLSLDGAGEQEELRHARRHLDRFAVPWLAIPGNHDIDGNPLPGSPQSALCSTERNRHPTGLPTEEEQWGGSRTKFTLRLQTGPSRSSVTNPWLRPRSSSHRRLRSGLCSIGPHSLEELLATRSLRLVISGHVHQQRTLQRAGTGHIWTPSRWAALPETIATHDR